MNKEILEILQQDATIERGVIARMLGMTEEDVAAAIAAMEEQGIIIKYAAQVNTEKMGDEAVAEAMIGLKVMPEREHGYDDIARRVYKFPEVKAVYLLSGSWDLCARVEAKTMKAISQFVWEKLAVLDGISSTETMFIMRKYKENGNMLTEEEKEDRLVVTA